MAGDGNVNQPVFDPYLKWLGIRTPQRPPDHYALLGLKAFEDDADVIANAADRQMAHVKTFQSGKFVAASQQLLNELAAAQACLLNPAQKRNYDEHLRRQQREHAAGWAETAVIDAPDLQEHTTARQAAPSEADAEPAAIVVSDRPSARRPRRRRMDAVPLLLLFGTAAMVAALGWRLYQRSPTTAGPGPVAVAVQPPAANGGVLPPAPPLAPAPSKAPSAAENPPGDSTPATVESVSVESALSSVIEAERDKPAPASRARPLLGPAEALDEAERALKRREAGSAGALLKIAEQASAGDAALKRRWQRLTELHAALDTLTRAVADTVGELAGQAELTQGDRRWRIVDMQGTQLTVSDGGGQKTLLLSDLPAKALLELVKQGSHAADAGARRAAAALVLYDPTSNLAYAQRELDELSVLAPVADDPLLQQLLREAEARTRPAETTAAAHSAAATAVQLARSPWPAGEALAEAQNKVQQTFAAQLAEAKEADARVAAVVALIAAARDETLLGVERAAILQEARQQATTSGSADAVAAVEATVDAYFRVDRLALEAEALAIAATHARHAGAQEALVRRALEVGRRAALADRYEVATQATGLAAGAAKKLKHADLQRQCKSQTGEIRRWHARHQDLADDLTAVTEGVATPQQSLAVATFRCFEQLRWEDGLPALAESDHEKLAALAAIDLKGPRDTGQRLRLADGWWQAGQEGPVKQRPALRQRAAHWYAALAPQLAGLERTRVQQRLREHQAEQGAGTSPLTAALPSVRVQLLPGGGLVRFRLIPAGVFLMGPPGRAHEVTLTRPFYLAETEITVAQWNALRPNDPRPVDERHPAEAAVGAVRWEDCGEFLAALGQLPAESPLEVRLPTEAEWEYACRAGAATRYSYGDGPQGLAEYAWFGAGESPQLVARKRANDWGLYDMHGNVWEWCQDRWGDYTSQPQVDPQGINWGDRRVLRGGGFRSRPEQCRADHRHSDLPASGKDDYGFRVALEP